MVRAVKYYRVSAEKQNASGQNSFGICLERGSGVRRNALLAAVFYRRAADQGHADGANNFGFCLEHGRGVEHNFELAAKYYKLAADRGHPEAQLNHARCLRLLGRWQPPDRSSEFASTCPSPARLTELFRESCENPGPLDSDGLRLLDSLERLKSPPPVRGAPSGSGVAWTSVKVSLDSRTDLIAVKTARKGDCMREAAILKGLKHPLVVELRGDPGESVATRFAGNGTLTAFLSSGILGANRENHHKNRSCNAIHPFARSRSPRADNRQHFVGLGLDGLDDAEPHGRFS
jgi:hypothetical protein